MVALPDCPIEPSQADERGVLAFDKYTEGNYAAAAELAKKLLLELPTSIQFYELYVKSLIFSSQKFVSPFAEHSPAHGVLTAVDSVFRKSPNYNQALENLSRHAKSYYHTQLAMGLYYFIASERDPKTSLRWEKLALLNSPFLDPKLYLASYEDSFQKDILKRLFGVFPNSLALSFLTALLENAEPTTAICFPEKLSPERKLRYTASALYQRGAYDKAIPLFERLYSNRKDETNVTRDYPTDTEFEVSLVFSGKELITV